jgi:hypothetical protein
VLLGVLAALVLGGGAFAATQLLGKHSGHPAMPNRTGSTPAVPSPTPPLTQAQLRATTTVAILNGTAIPNLAANTRDQLTADGYKAANIATGNNTDQQRVRSQVFYRAGARRQAADVARTLGIDTPPQSVDADTQALADNAGKGKTAEVIVIVGGDKAR